VLIGAGGLLALTWDLWFSRWIGKGKARWHRRKRERDNAPMVEETQDFTSSQQATETYTLARRRVNSVSSAHLQGQSNHTDSLGVGTEAHSEIYGPLSRAFYAMPIWAGLVVIVAFFGKIAAHTARLRQ
jgi:hypothetical protein